MYGPEHVPAPRRHPAEREDAHPVFRAFQDNRIGAAFRRAEVRDKVIPAYMGLVRQCDDQLGRLLDHLEATGRMDDTMIVLTSDHGDYLGDHWLGEKELFHDPSVKVPLIIRDPRPAADATRGSTCDALVEAIDLLPTFLEAAGGTIPDHILEGRSLAPWLHGTPPEAWRGAVISEYDFGATAAATALGLAPRDCRLFMVFDGRHKLMHCAAPGLRPMLFDLETDPDEYHDLCKGGADHPALDALYGHLHAWGLRMSQRVTRSEADIIAGRGRSARKGILLHLYDGSEADPELTAKYRGPARQIHLPDDSD